MYAHYCPCLQYSIVDRFVCDMHVQYFPRFQYSIVDRFVCLRARSVFRSMSHYNAVTYQSRVQYCHPVLTRLASSCIAGPVAGGELPAAQKARLRGGGDRQPPQRHGDRV